MLDELLEGEDAPDEELEEEEEASPVPTATVDKLKKKKRVTKTITLVVTGDDGEPEKVSLTFRGISAYEYDRLISRFPPRGKDKKQGFTYNPDKFGPELIAATCIEPDLSVEDVTEIWESDDWNRGERMQLLMTAIEVCTTGLSVPKSWSAFG